jgi:hypothetical protein
LTLIATGRDNNIAPVIALQDFSQLKINYSHPEAEGLVNTLGNIVCGQAQGETAKIVSNRFQMVMQTQISRTYNSRDISVSESEHHRTAISPATLSNLSAGEFVGIVADDPDTPIELKGFHARIVNEEGRRSKKGKDWLEIPGIRQLEPEDVDANYHRIKQEVRDLVKKEISRRQGDPEL